MFGRKKNETKTKKKQKYPWTILVVISTLSYKVGTMQDDMPVVPFFLSPSALLDNLLSQYPRLNFIKVR